MPVAVAAVVMDNVIFLFQGSDAADGRSFHTDRKVHGTVHQAAGVKRFSVLFEITGLIHLFQHFGPFFARKLFEQTLSGFFVHF